MNNLDKQYQKLLLNILENGVEKSDRTGTGTLSVFGEQIVHNMNEGFPLLTTKKMAIKSIMTELKWFLKGRTDISIYEIMVVRFGMVILKRRVKKMEHLVLSMVNNGEIGMAMTKLKT